MFSKVRMVTVVLAVTCLAAAGIAEAAAPKLKVPTAKRVTTDVALETGKVLDGTTFGDGSTMNIREWSLDPCLRKHRRHLVCRFHLYGTVIDAEGNEFLVDCWTSVSVKYAGKRGRRLAVRPFGSDCGSDYGGSQDRRPLPDEEGV